MERVTFEGGPLDGGDAEVSPGAPEVEITMSDGTRHRYARRIPAPPDGSTPFDWRGRR